MTVISVDGYFCITFVFAPTPLDGRSKLDKESVPQLVAASFFEYSAPSSLIGQAPCCIYCNLLGHHDR